MRVHLRMPVLLSVFLVLLHLPAVTADDLQMPFDGHSLESWEGDLKHWRVENGAIVGEIPKGQSLNKNTWLVWRGGELADFDLNLQCRMTGLPAANSGIQFRCQVENVDYVSGYQADFDMGATWLGRIYDEHGRALLVERGSRVDIQPDGKQRVEVFAPANQYTVLFRENDWNDYRIVAIGDRVAIYVNGTLFSELRDQQTGEQDLKGQLAFQLHSGPETRVEFRNIRIEHLKTDNNPLKPFQIRPQQPSAPTNAGVEPVGADGKALNLSFEAGDLTGWTATGNAFSRQPVSRDGISQRWQGQVSNKVGDFFIGGYEIVQDAGTGTLISSPFRVTHPYGSFLFGGGEDKSTRAEVLLLTEDQKEESIIASASGSNREQMDRIALDLSRIQGRRIAIRLVDENPGAWGHLNFDDFRFHDEPPVAVTGRSAWRSTFNPLLNHLVPNADARRATRRQPSESSLSSVTSPMKSSAAEITTSTMFVPEGFSVDVIAAEPDLHQPMAFAFDAKGRLWVVEGHSYPQKRPDGEGLDRVLIFADSDHDGTYETRKVFAEKLNLVSGLEIGHGGVWVGAAPQLLFIPDRDDDDVPDSDPQVLLDGFGFADTHETLNSFLWGPDGWLYGNQGVFNSSKIGKPGASDNQRISLSAGVWRYHPTKHLFEVFAHGGSNQWGLDYDEHGQLFMTYCRSFWGRGDVTHVMLGAHYWNQVNSGYAPFISTQAPPGRPWMANYLLASARYGHGEGGSGKAGSNDVYGGHSHVGTMIYLGDNWPEQYRNHLFTHNLHGHQMNHVVNRREAGGYNSVHAGYDVLFCGDQQYIGVDLQYGPDGSVFISDWYDPRHCHNPNAEQWDRGNGRMYRMKYDATWKPIAVDYTKASEDELVAAQSHPNDWHARTARLELARRSADARISAEVVDKLTAMVAAEPSPAGRLKALWTLHVIDHLSWQELKTALADESEYVRAWAVQIATENPSHINSTVTDALVKLAQTERSLFVRRALASAVQRVPFPTGWLLSEAICFSGETASDRDLPLLLWHGLAPLVAMDADRAFRLASATQVPAIADYIHWYSAASSETGREKLSDMIAQQTGDEQLRSLELLSLAVQDARNLTAPKGWSDTATSLYEMKDARITELTETIGVALGDNTTFARIRQRISSGSLTGNTLLRSLRMLSADSSPDNLPLYLSLLDNAEIAPQVIPLLGRFSDRKVPNALLSRLSELEGPAWSSAMEVLCARVSSSNELLDHIADGKVSKSQLTAFYVRQMASLNDAKLTARLEAEWGKLGQSSDEVKAEIQRMSTAYKTAPLWAYNDGAGAVHFKKLCAQCHLPSG
ncbi:MAG: PVC-type heme-binding CxxCH protein, partial [Planctomycetota bacterium]